MTEIARLRIELDEVQPRVMRRIEAPLAMRLDDLHLAIQIAMGWENYHLYEFRAGKTAWGEPDPEWDFSGTETLPAKGATLADLLGRGRKTFSYVYDFGDDWRHTVRLEGVTAAAPDTPYPRLIEAEGRCPPEDIGGPWGYGAFLEAMADPEHERHEEMVEWCGPEFDPNQVDRDAIGRELLKLAKRLARPKPKAARRRTS